MGCLAAIAAGCAIAVAAVIIFIATVPPQAKRLAACEERGGTPTAIEQPGGYYNIDCEDP